jgi:hypothetical protein
MMRDLETRIINGPTGICDCGHFDNIHGHASNGAERHGRCLVVGCACARFTWRKASHPIWAQLEWERQMERRR